METRINALRKNAVLEGVDNMLRKKLAGDSTKERSVGEKRFEHSSDARKQSGKAAGVVVKF